MKSLVSTPPHLAFESQVLLYSEDPRGFQVSLQLQRSFQHLVKLHLAARRLALLPVLLHTCCVLLQQKLNVGRHAGLTFPYDHVPWESGCETPMLPRGNESVEVGRMGTKSQSWYLPCQVRAGCMVPNARTWSACLCGALIVVQPWCSGSWCLCS